MWDKDIELVKRDIFSRLDLVAFKIELKCDLKNNFNRDSTIFIHLDSEMKIPKPSKSSKIEVWI